MKMSHCTWCLVALLALVTVIMSAPVQQSESSKSLADGKKLHSDKPAHELEQVSKTESVIIPAAPVVVKVTEETETASKQQTKEPKVEFLQDAKLEEPASKRKFPSFSANMINNDEIGALSGRQRQPTLYPIEPDMDLSPRAVAEYLLVTSDYNGFEQAMADLMNIGVLSPAEILEYKDSVSWEYENLLRQMAQAESQYLQELSGDYYNTIQGPIRSYPEYPYNQNSLQYPDPEPVLDYRQQIPALLSSYPQRITPDQEKLQSMLGDKSHNLDDVLSMVLDEYFGKNQDYNDIKEYDEQVPQEIPEEIQSYVPAQTADQSYEPPQTADQSYVPVQTADQSYEPVQTADQSYEPLQTADQSYMPAQTADQSYMPAQTADQSYEPPQTADNDDEMKQFIAYLQQTLTREEAGAGIIEIPEKGDILNGDAKSHSEPDVVQELDNLTGNGSEKESEENSGEVDTAEVNSKPEIQSASS